MCDSFSCILYVIYREECSLLQSKTVDEEESHDQIIREMNRKLSALEEQKDRDMQVFKSQVISIHISSSVLKNIIPVWFMRIVFSTLVMLLLTYFASRYHYDFGVRKFHINDS